MKKIQLFQIGCAVILFFLNTSHSHAASFIDIPANYINSDAIEYVKANGIVSGYPDGNFKPDNSINRAEFTKIIVGAQFNTTTIDNCIAENSRPDWVYAFFRDVPMDAWYTKYICMAKVHGIIQGYPDGSFGPAKDINFAEASKIIVNAFGYSVATNEVWYKPFVEKLDEKKSIPTTITNFDKKITRGEMVEMVYRLKANITNKPSATYNSIDSKTSVNSVIVTPTPSQIITSNVPKKFLTLIWVNKGAEGKYEANNWERGRQKFNENNDVQIFDVAMWDNGQPDNPNKISVYKFDKTFNPFKTEYSDGGANWVNYRESFNILNVDVLQACSLAQGPAYYACSHAYLGAFKLIIETIVRNHPAEHYGLKYSGHGSDAGLFANTFSTDDSQLLLLYINSVIGKKLDFLDWSTNCDMGSYSVIASQYRYADYILSSDLLRGGFNIDWINDYYRLKSEAILDSFFSPSKTIKQSLADMVDSERMLWETATTKSDMIAKQIKQSLSIYDSSKFEDLVTSAHLEGGIQGNDVLDYIRQNYPSLEQKFYDFRFHYISNKDFFPWDLNFNGFKIVY